MRTIFRTNKDILTFAEEIKSVFLSKGVVVERMLNTAKKLCEDSRVVTETAAKDGDEHRKSLKDPSQKWKFQDAKAQRASVKELRQMVTFLKENEVPIGKSDTTHFERFALFSKLELQKALAVIKESNQGYIELLEYFGGDMNTQAGDFFGLLDSFLAEFDRVVDVVEKEEEEKLKETRRRLAKQAKEKVKSAFKIASGVDAQLDVDGDAKPMKAWRENPILKPTLSETKGDKPAKATSVADYTKKPHISASNTMQEPSKFSMAVASTDANSSNLPPTGADDNVDETSSKTLTRNPRAGVSRALDPNNDTFKARPRKSSTSSSNLAPIKTKSSRHRHRIEEGFTRQLENSNTD